MLKYLISNQFKVRMNKSSKLLKEDQIFKDKVCHLIHFPFLVIVVILMHQITNGNHNILKILVIIHIGMDHKAKDNNLLIKFPVAGATGKLVSTSVCRELVSRELETYLSMEGKPIMVIPIFWISAPYSAATTSYFNATS